MIKDNSFKIGDSAFSAPSLQESVNEMNYGGALSFLRRKYSKDLSKAEVAIAGIPFDCATTGRPGSRFGPRSVREASTSLAELPATGHVKNPIEEMSIIDYGDFFIKPGYPQLVQETIFKIALNIINSDTHLISIGGDHFITYPLLQAHARKYGPISLLQFDSHCDTWEDDGIKIDHGTMFSRALKEGIINKNNSIQVGIRTINNTDVGIKQISASSIHKKGLNNTINTILNHIGNSPCYLSFDIDFLDPAFAPGTGTPVCGGFSTWQTFELLRNLSILNFIGMDLVEVSPIYDHAEITSLAGASIIQEYLCLLLIKKENK